MNARIGIEIHSVFFENLTDRLPRPSIFRSCCKKTVVKKSRNAHEEFVPVRHIHSSTCSVRTVEVFPLVAPRIVEAPSQSSRKLAQTMLLGYEKDESCAERGKDSQAELSKLL
jgi:hypothetical protein